ncbi:MAG: phosphopantothenate/pantothenate synthetase [Candidatus Thorarchaeota archaeon]
MNKYEVPPKHPRATSLRIRTKLVHGFESGITSTFGLFAHGRGEAFDYLIGEKTTKNAKRAIKVAAANLILGQNSVLSVNGNVAALVPKELVKLAKVSEAKLEINLYHRSREREKAIAQVLKDAGAKEIYGLDSDYHETIPEIHSERRIVDHRGLFIADVVFVPLEDGDRTEGLVRLGKRVITVDLNPLSRTAQMANITIVDNVVRALPLLITAVRKLRNDSKKKLQAIIDDFDNQQNLSEAIHLINNRLRTLAETQRLLNSREEKK